YHHFAGAAWMPWVLLALERTVTRGDLSSALALGATAAAELLAGSGDMCLMTGVLGSARTLWRVLSEARGARLRAAAGLARSCLVAGIFGVTLTAVQWLPTAALLREGSRLDMPPRVSMF